MGGFYGHECDFPINCPLNIGNVIIPTDELIIFRGVAQPPTSDENMMKHDKNLGTMMKHDDKNDENMMKTDEQ